MRTYQKFLFISVLFLFVIRPNIELLVQSDSDSALRLSVFNYVPMLRKITSYITHAISAPHACYPYSNVFPLTKVNYPFGYAI